jgi:hypothetical protein
MIIKQKPKIDQKLKILFDKLLNTDDKTLPMHQRFLKTMEIPTRELFMQYFSYTTQYDLKEYELLKRQYKNNEKLLLDSMLDLVTDYKDSAVWKTDHLKLVRGIYLGSMYQIKYKKFKHDPFPLAIFLNTYDTKHQNFHAINLHYFIPQFREYFVDRVLDINKPRISQNQEPILTMQMVNKLIPDIGLAFRNYKAEEIRIIEKINHNRWKTYLQIDSRKVNF